MEPNDTTQNPSDALTDSTAPATIDTGASDSDSDSDSGYSVIERLTPLNVTIEVDAPQELTFSSYALAGLFDLEHSRLVRRVTINPIRGLHRGELTLTEPGVIEQPRYRAKCTTFLTIRHGQHSTRCAIDFRDSARIFALDALRNCDVFFKRSFEPDAIAALSSTLESAAEPLGLCLGANSPYSRHRIPRWAGYWGAAFKDSLRPDREILSRARRHWRANLAHWQATRTHPSTEYLQSLRSTTGGRETRQTRETVFFQTRSFNRTDDPDANEIHEQRADLIRTLRREFGDSFVGGFIPDQLVRERYPDCVSSIAHDKAAYYGAMRDASIAIHTRGLAGADAFKLSEYFAHGKCVVGEPVRARLPNDLQSGVEWLTFESPDDCVETCSALLADPARRSQLAGSARDYYERWIDPMVSMHRVVSRAIGLTT